MPGKAKPSVSGVFEVSPEVSTEPSRKRIARLFHALADETRLRILDQLADRELCVCDLSGALEAGQSRLSFHLKTLKEAGLLIDRRDGRWIYYAVNRNVLSEMREALNGVAMARHGALSIIPSRCQ